MSQARYLACQWLRLASGKLEGELSLTGMEGLEGQ